MSKVGKNIISALDIGNSKVVCFIARIEPDKNVEVIGIGHQLSRGIKGGKIIDIYEAENSITEAVAAAEEMAGIRVDKLVVNIFSKLNSNLVAAEMVIDGREILQRDIDKLLQHACSNYINDHEAIIHCIPSSFKLDENNGIKNPIGMFGNTLNANVNIVTTSSSSLFNLANCLAKCHLESENYISSAFASSVACLTNDDKELGAVVIDIGGGNTSIAVYNDGEVVYLDNFPIGGKHITNDIAIGLSIDIANAERVKILYGSAIIDESGFQNVDISKDKDEVDHIQKQTLTKIIRPRIEENIQIAKKMIENAGYSNFRGKIYLTGGTSNLNGIRDLTAEIFNRQVKIGKIYDIEGLAENMKGPSFATCAGIIKYVANNYLKTSRKNHGNGISFLINRYIKWFKDNF